MSNLDVIRQIEKKLEVPLKRVSLEEIAKVQEWPTKAYALDDNDNVIGLQLDAYAISLDAELAELCHLSILTLRYAHIDDENFLRDLKGLTSLDLRRTNVANLSFLRERKGLTSLNLSGTNISDLSFLKDLKGLTSLDLSETEVSDLAFLKELKGLTSLDLSETEVSDLSFLKELKGLISLSLSGIKDFDISFLKNMKGLTLLDLSDTKVSDLSFLKELKGLTSLDLSEIEVSDLSFLKELKGLISLSLSGTKDFDISFLKELKELTTLDLGGTEISDLSFLKELKGLTTLKMSLTKVANISFLKELKGLTTLDLGGTIDFDLSFLKGLTGLTSLNLGRTNVFDLSFLKEMKGLTSFELWGTKVHDLSFLKELKELTSLFLGGADVADLSFLKELKGLTLLGLRGTNISDLSFLRGMKGLTSLVLIKTNVSDLSIIEYLPSLVRIHLIGTDNLVEPPRHIAKKGHEAIRNYFRQKREQGTGYLYEAKVLIVGEPGAGKTSLRKKLIEPGYIIPNKEEISTLGIEVEKDWNFPYAEDNKITFHASLWDFGGQDIQYMIHQYFLTGKSLYILVADERKQNTHYEYWFNIIKLLGEGSPVLVVLNKREGAAITSYDHAEICKAFPDLRIDKFELDMAKEKTSFDALREKIKSMLCGLEHIGEELPAKWPLIRTSLEGMKEKNHISLDEYFDICAGHGIKDEKDALVLADYLHALGTVLHFKDDDLLRDLVITNHNWVVDALYTALSDKQIELDCGSFTRKWLFDLWKKQKQNGKKGYTDEECRQLLNLMNKEKFELCYELDEKGHFISPQLLPQAPPEYRFNFSGGLEFRFRHAFMPEGLLSRLIVRLNHLIRKEQGRQLVWRYGTVLEREGCLAEIIQTRFSSEGHRDISVRVNGSDYRKKELLTIISNEIEDIHRKSFRHIDYNILIPCNSTKCTTSGSPKLFQLDELNKLVGFGDASTRCTECGELINIYSLVVGMAPDSAFMPMALRGKINSMKAYEIGLSTIDRFEDAPESGMSWMNMQLMEIAKLSLQKTTPINVIVNSTSSSTSTADVDVNINIDVNIEVKGFSNLIELIKEDLPDYVSDDSERKLMEKEFEKINRAAKEIATLPKEEAKGSTQMARLKEFVEKLENADTNIGKAFKAVDNGIERARKIAGYYNSIAQWCGLPQVPPPFTK